MLLNTIFLILGLGPGEMALVGLALVLMFGAKKIPELARGLGKGIREFKDATKDVKSEIDKSLEENN
jgi:sec-independent protein translocase protein TatA